MTELALGKLSLAAVLERTKSLQHSDHEEASELTFSAARWASSQTSFWSVSLFVGLSFHKRDRMNSPVERRSSETSSTLTRPSPLALLLQELRRALLE